MAASLDGIYDLALYQARKFGLNVSTKAQVDALLARLENDQTLVRCTLPPMLESVVMTINGKEVVVIWRPSAKRIEQFQHPHPKGMITKAALRYAMNGGIPVDQDHLKRIITEFERPTVAKHVVSDDGLLRSATIIVDGDKLDVTVDCRSRMIVRVGRYVLRFATVHAIERAKQRYDLPLTYDVAEEMVMLMRAGKFVPNAAAPGDERDTIRGTVHYDMEDFTVVYDPTVEKIVTVTPLGDWDRKRKQRGE